MKLKDHLKKAKRIEEDFNRVKSKEAKAECFYGSILNYLAYICEQKIGKHKDSHKNLHKFLIENNFSKLASLWEESERIREGGWYGKKGFPQRGFEILKEIKKVVR